MFLRLCLFAEHCRVFEGSFSHDFMISALSERNLGSTRFNKPFRPEVCQ